ncbi:hypothetical protein KFL_002300110 [Klebsormidium nitens]|uniref:Uncharacterized protein n=1 Tax=Klebsormidium nitens TaxID=105231 RepID=A0A1Y1I7D8_KLENI|nr:hypothetical protein KFL_002300110 [Klebsormidium nitens]|eukprot:GAQ85339.1 hypothetical protein KFL_002300110 [Klebsormidium nitens]
MVLPGRWLLQTAAQIAWLGKMDSGKSSPWFLWGPHVSMAKARLQIALPEDPFYDLKENRSPGRDGALIMASPKPLKTPKTTRSRERRLECLQWALETAQDQQVALLEGARAQLESARAHAAHVEGQVAQLQGKLAYVAECRHAEHSTYQGEVAKLKSEMLGLSHENKALTALLDSRAKEHEAQLAGLVQKHASEKEEHVDKEEALAKEKGDALAEVQSLRVAMESARKGCEGLERKRDQLQKEVRGLEGLRKARDDALAEARGLKADLANAQLNVKKTMKEKAEGLRASESRLAACRMDLESVRKEKDNVQKENESVRKENEDVGTENEKVRKLNERLQREVRLWRQEYEWDKVAREKAAAEAEKAESARARARKDLESALSRLVESQRARAGLQRELAEGLEVLAGVKRHQEAAEKAYKERVSELEDEVRRLRATGAAGFGGFGRAAGQTSPEAGVTSAVLGAPGSGGCQAETDPRMRRADSAHPVARSNATSSERPGVNTSVKFEATKGGPSFFAEQPAQKTAVPAFELGTGDSAPGVERNPLGNRRKVLVARRPAIKKDVGAGEEGINLDYTNQLAVTAFGSVACAEPQKGFGPFSGPLNLSGPLESGAAFKSLSRCSGTSAEEELAAEESQRGCDTCRRGGGPEAETGSAVRREGHVSDTVQRRRVVGCLRKQVRMDALFEAMLSPTRQRRVLGFRRSGRNAVGPLSRRRGRFPVTGARRLVPELLPLVALLIRRDQSKSLMMKD